MTFSKGFKDIRPASELLGDARLPKSLSYRFTNPVSSKFNSLVSKVSGLKSVVSGSAIGKFALVGAAKVSAAFAGFSIAASLAGTAVNSVKKVASNSGLGVIAIPETDPEKIRKPQKDGLSTNPAMAGEPLSKLLLKEF